MTRILVVDDDPRIRSLVHRQLTAAGYEVIEGTDGRAALERMAGDAPALVVLDLSMPGVGGLDVLRAVRTGQAGVAEDLPVVILSGRDGETDRVIGLDLGADDYLVKPFSAAELAARVRSVLRRAGPDPTGTIVVGPLRIESATHEVRVGGSRIDLTAKEFDLIVFLAAHPRQVFTRHQLLHHIWKATEWLGEATVTEHVHRVRGKLEAAGGPRMIRTVRGVGYCLDVPA